MASAEANWNIIIALAQEDTLIDISVLYLTLTKPRLQ